MIVANSDLISRYPAQLYYSALPFLPSETYLARQYPIPRGGISVVTGRENSWTPLLFTLPQLGDVAAAFSPRGHMVAVASLPGVIQIHNASNGLLNSSIRSISSARYHPSSAAFTKDGSGVVVVLSPSAWLVLEFSHQILKFNLVKQSGQICRTPCSGHYPPKLSEYGSYVAFPESKNGDTWIRIRRTDGGEDISISLDCGGKVQDLDLAGGSAHLCAAVARDITVLSIPSGAVQRTLCHKGAERVCISRDGSFLASVTHSDEARIWSITQGTLLATFKGHLVAFSRTNRLYLGQSGSFRVYDMSADSIYVVIKSFPLPSTTLSILPP